MTVLDMHNHSLASDDARASVEQYAKWVQMLRRKGVEMDGFVLTEHRTFDPSRDFGALMKRYGLLILQGAELDTDAGHFLVYGVSEELRRRFDFADVRTPAEELVRAAAESGGLAVPAHVGRRNIGFCDFLANGRVLEGVRVVEHLNGGSTPWETRRAQALVAERGYVGIAGSDAHFVNRIGRCLTRFLDPVRTIEDVVRALQAGRVEAFTVHGRAEAKGASSRTAEDR